MDENRGIGIDNRLPWRLSDDLKRFKKLTLGHHIIMGRKTFESIGKALPGRENIIVTRNLGFHAPGCLITNSPLEAIELARKRGEEEVFVIGGEEIFRNVMDIADRFYLTIVHSCGNADIYFPELDRGYWQEEYSETFPADESNEFATTFKILERSI
jgi:dihydrofolate reductase